MSIWAKEFEVVSRARLRLYDQKLSIMYDEQQSKKYSWQISKKQFKRDVWHTFHGKGTHVQQWQRGRRN